MATLSIVVPDTVVPRIRDAFGSEGTPATAAQILAELKAFLRARVTAFESTAAYQTKQSAVNAETW